MQRLHNLETVALLFTKLKNNYLKQYCKFIHSLNSTFVLYELKKHLNLNT